METVEIVVDDGRLFVRWSDGTLSPVRADMFGNVWVAEYNVGVGDSND